MAKFVVISLGGSLIVPHLSDDGGVDVAFLRKFRAFIVGEIKKGKRFIIVAGGGKTTRVYQKAATLISKASSDDLDWVGIASTKLNAHVLLSMFRAAAYPHIIDHEPSAREIEKLTNADKSLYIASGWVPGQSTDHVAVRLAQKFGARDVVNASNIPFVYDKDPKKHKDAKPIRGISWREYRKLIPQKWTPGLSTPIDPVAARLAEKTGLQVKIIKGSDLKNFKRAIDDKPFQGTTVT